MAEAATTRQLLQNVFQAGIVAAFLAVGGVLWSVYNDVQTLKNRQEDLVEDFKSLEIEVEKIDDREDTIRLSLITIETELPHIRTDIEELGTLIKARF